MWFEICGAYDVAMNDPYIHVWWGGGVVSVSMAPDLTAMNQEPEQWFASKRHFHTVYNYYQHYLL